MGLLQPERVTSGFLRSVSLPSNKPKNKQSPQQRDLSLTFLTVQVSEPELQSPQAEREKTRSGLAG